MLLGLPQKHQFMWNRHSFITYFLAWTAPGFCSHYRRDMRHMLQCLCCTPFTIVTPHLLTLSPDNINMMQSETQQQTQSRKKTQAQRDPTETHMHTVSYKTALLTLANAQSVLLKGAGQQIQQWAIWTEQQFITSDLNASSPTARGLQRRRWKREGRWTDHLHLKRAFAMQMSRFHL